MPSKQKHRGQHQEDPTLFADRMLPKLNEAVRDLSYLLSHAYPENASIKLVGDRYRLTQRQRKALMRASCTDQSLTHRQQILLEKDALQGTAMAIDGYNLLITIEAALAGGIVIECRDGYYRDIASVHGTYRRVEETKPALVMIGVSLQKLGVEEVVWYVDKPVSNSGRLKGLMYEIAGEYDFPWSVKLSNNPDKVFPTLTDTVVVSSDGWVLDRVPASFNLHKYLVNTLPGANLILLHGL
ncbi:MAG: DUF434 domain-containing protein [Bacteroidota bacterium]